MNKPPYQVLIGNCDEALDELFIRLLEHVLQSRFDLRITKTDQLARLTEEAASRRFDLCLVVLNNVIVPETAENPSVRDRMSRVLDFIAIVKAKHRTPVIALSGHADPWLADRAGFAGVDFYFTLPVDPADLEKAFGRCLRLAAKAHPPSFSQKIAPLPNPDQMHLSAAQGWLELGNHLEANEELENVTPELRVHPDVLELRWQVYAKATKWEVCVDIGDALVKTAPERPFGWLHRSVALHKLKRTEEASDLLLAAADLWPGHWRICYNLACYACQLGNQEEAWDWLEQAFELADDQKAVKTMALDDPDLEPFWAEIGEI